MEKEEKKLHTLHWFLNAAWHFYFILKAGGGVSQWIMTYILACFSQNVILKQNVLYQSYILMVFYGSLDGNVVLTFCKTIFVFYRKMKVSFGTTWWWVNDHKCFTFDELLFLYRPKLGIYKSVCTCALQTHDFFCLFVIKYL